MCAKKKVTPPADKLLLYDSLIASIPGLERKGVSLPYTSCNGNMFSYLSDNGTLALRLGQEDRDAFIATHDAEYMVSHGVLMKEYVKVPDALLSDIRKMKKYMAVSYAYAQTLKPKK